VQGWLLLAMVLWGVNVSAVKTLTATFEPLTLAAVRMVVACCALSAIVLWRRSGLPALHARQIAALAGCAFLMVYANQILFAQGLQRSTATNGALIMALSPLVSALMAALVFGERFTPRRMLGVALGFAGVAAVVLSHPGAGLSSAGIGDLMLALSVVSFAVGGAGVQRLARQIDPLSISWVIYIIGTLMLVVHAVLGPLAAGHGAAVSRCVAMGAGAVLGHCRHRGGQPHLEPRHLRHRHGAHRRVSLLGAGVRRGLCGAAARRNAHLVAPGRLCRGDDGHLARHAARGRTGTGAGAPRLLIFSCHA
jgi:drug/metabolite transporter (DMT)-like permease